MVRQNNQSPGIDPNDVFGDPDEDPDGVMDDVMEDVMEDVMDDVMEDVPRDNDVHFFPHTDTGNAELFAHRYSDRIRYDHKQERWLVWNGERWFPDNTGGGEALGSARRWAMRVRAMGALFLIGVVLIAACGGGGDGERDEDAIRRNVERADEIIFGDEVGLIQFQQYVARECRDADDLGDLLIGRGSIETLVGDAEVRFDVTNVEFLADDRALVSVRILVDGEAGLLGEDDDDTGLWVLQDGTWRSADDCEFYGTLESDDADEVSAEGQVEVEVTPSSSP